MRYSAAIASEKVTQMLGYRERTGIRPRKESPSSVLCLLHDIFAVHNVEIMICGVDMLVAMSARRVTPSFSDTQTTRRQDARHILPSTLENCSIQKHNESCL